MDPEVTTKNADAGGELSTVGTKRKAERDVASCEQEEVEGGVGVALNSNVSYNYSPKRDGDEATMDSVGVENGDKGGASTEMNPPISKRFQHWTDEEMELLMKGVKSE